MRTFRMNFNAAARMVPTGMFESRRLRTLFWESRRAKPGDCGPERRTGLTLDLRFEI